MSPKVKVNFVKFCDYACRVDGSKGCIIGMFDTIGGSEFPITHPTFYVCVEFEFDPFQAGQTTVVKMRLIDEDGRDMMGIDGEFPVPPSELGRPATMFELFRIDGLQFPKPGNYRLDVIHDEEPIGEARLYLVQGPPPGH